MLKDLDDFYSQSKNIVEAFEKFETEVGLKEIAVADHICYKCSSSEEFETTRSFFESQGFLYQSIISKRRIAVIKLEKSIDTSLGTIQYLELSDQKPDGSQKSGFDHIEIYPKGVTVEMLAEKILDTGRMGKKVERPHHTTYDFPLDNFLVRIESEALIEKIKFQEMQ